MNARAQATEHFVEKWYRREPEMRIASSFCARADRGPDDGADKARSRFECWGALLHELREAVFELPDAGVAAAKRGWWAEEVQHIPQGRARHPLGEALAGLAETKSAPWTALSLAVVGGGGESRAADTTATLAALHPLAAATIAVENALFHSRDEKEEAARSLAVHWLLQRLPRGLADEDGARVPMHLLARHGLTASALPTASDAFLRDWGGELQSSMPAPIGGAFLRRARARFDLARLHRLRAKGGQGGFDDPGAVGTLWRAWRAARSG